MDTDKIEQEKEEQKIDPNKKIYKKEKVAIFFGYNGKSFHGSQKNPLVHTVEAELETALFNSDFITKAHFGDLHKLHWGRGARTDKGVHALQNCVNANLTFEKSFFVVNKDGQENEKRKQFQRKKKTLDKKKIINIINSNLNIGALKIFDIKQAAPSFYVRNSARSRKYEYICPISLFDIPTAFDVQTYLKDVIKSNNLITFIQKTIESIEKYNDKHKQKLTVEELTKKVEGLAKKFIGTKNYHNYTQKIKYTDKTAKRYIMNIDVELIKLDELIKKFGADSSETTKIIEEAISKKDSNANYFLLFQIHGAGFMYNQIRKMVGMLIQTCQEKLSDSYLENSFFSNVYYIPLAPPEGLYLNRITFEGYNKKFDIPEKIEFDSEIEENMQKFKDEVIYPQILADQFVNHKFAQWNVKNYFEALHKDEQIKGFEIIEEEEPADEEQSVD